MWIVNDLPILTWILRQEQTMETIDMIQLNLAQMPSSNQQWPHLVSVSISVIMVFVIVISSFIFSTLITT